MERKSGNNARVNKGRKKKKIARVQDRDITPSSRNSIPLEFRLGDE